MVTRKRAQNGQGTVTPRTLVGGAIVYDTWITVDDPETGAPVRIAKRGHKTHPEAVAFNAQQMTDSKNGISALAANGGLTVGQCLAGWKEVSTLKESTTAEYERVFDALADEEIGETPIRSLRQVDIDRMLGRMNREGVPATRLGHLVIALEHIWEYAKSAGAVQFNCITDSKWKDHLFRTMRNERAERDAQKLEEGYVEVITPEQYKSLLESERRMPLRYLWEFIAGTGMRRGETLALRWGDISLDQGCIWIRVGIADVGGKIIHLKTPKGGRSRKIFIDDRTVDLLRRQRRLVDEYKATHGDAWEEHNLVFPQLDIRKTNKFPPGHWMLPSLLSVAYFRRAKALGFSSTKLHGLRFTWAKAAFDAGVEPRLIQEHMGHKDLDLTMFTYIKPDETSARAAVTMAMDQMQV